MRHKKRRGQGLLLPLVAVVVVAALAVTVTLALFVTNPPGATNTLALGKVDIEVDEGSFVSGVKITPGVPVAKAPTVQNKSDSVPVWVRVTVAGLENYTLTGLNTTDWTEYPANPGVFYYNTVLQPGILTSAIFEKVTLDSGFTGTEDELNIIVYAEAVQTWVEYNGAPATSAQEAFAALGGTS